MAPGAAPAPARRTPPGAARRLLRPPARPDHGGPARPQRLGRLRAPGAQRAGRVRGLRRLRRGRPPRRAEPARVGAHAGEPGPGAAVLRRAADRGAVRLRAGVLSDHGQAQGSTFAQLAGRPLREVVDELVSRGAATGRATGDDRPVETWGPATCCSPARPAASARRVPGRGGHPPRVPATRTPGRWWSRRPGAWPTSTSPTCPAGPAGAGRGPPPRAGRRARRPPPGRPGPRPA